MFFESFNAVPAAIWKWKDFEPAEIASKGDGSLLINIEAMNRLQRMRELLQHRLIILSAYRDPLHNARVGGAVNSMHKYGRAFDIALDGRDKEQLIMAAQQAGFTGFGLRYATFLHVDTGRARTW